MNRRDFLKSALAAGVGLGLASYPWPWKHCVAGEPAGGGGRPPDIVAIRNGEPEEMFDKGIAAMGGMGRFVKPGQKVAIKPNVSFDVGIEYAANTNPALVNRIVRHCLEAGASEVAALDHSIEYYKGCFEKSGIAAAVYEAGGVVAPAEAERYYHKTAVNGRVLKDALVHEAILDCDVLINVPILKHHGGTGITAGIKNLMGTVWDRRYYHANGLNQCIAEFLAVRTPDLTVVDAYRAMIGNGPRTRSLKDVKLMKMQILSTDIVAADASAARLLGKDPASFGHIRIASEMGFGTINPASLNARRISL